MVPYIVHYFIIEPQFKPTERRFVTCRGVRPWLQSIELAPSGIGKLSEKSPRAANVLIVPWYAQPPEHAIRIELTSIVSALLFFTVAVLGLF